MRSSTTALFATWNAAPISIVMAAVLIATIHFLIIVAFYRNTHAYGRNCIQTRFLDQLFKAPENRSLFLRWADDPVLAESHRKALAWGLEHETKDPA